MTHFRDFRPPEPDATTLQAEYASLDRALDEDADLMDTVERWEATRDEAWTWISWAQLRWRQDTRDDEARAARGRADRVSSELEQLDLRFLRRLLQGARREEVLARLPAQFTALLDSELAALDPAIAELRVREQDLVAEYVALTGGASFEVRGRTYDLSSVLPLTADGDRSLREDAARAQWGWFEGQRAELDRVFDELTGLRAEIAGALGHRDFVETGYHRMQRIDYDRKDVERWREQVHDRLVPLGLELRRRQAETLGIERVRNWDESVFDRDGGPQPPPVPEQPGVAVEALTRLHEPVGRFWADLVGRGMVDLDARPGKAPGGFCTWFGTERTPFVFSNAGGTSRDIRVLVHEAGHAFQAHCSRDIEPRLLRMPTLETAEIHSMGLEFLVWSQAEAFFGDRAEEYRSGHLAESLLFLPYGVAVDHFQHLVHEHPTASPAERHGMWSAMEHRYMPWKHEPDLPHVRAGGLWQRQRHVYASPFYYIDYTLALCVALQLWALAETDRDDALRRYEALCRAGGTLPFQALVRSVGLRSPFEDGCLEDVVAVAEKRLG